MANTKSNFKGKVNKERPSAYRGKQSDKRYDKYEKRSGKYEDRLSSMAKEMAGQSGNDISWWNKSSLYSSSVRVPFNVLSGVPMPENGLHSAPNVYEATPAGIMRVDFVPTIGTAFTKKSAINRAFQMIYGMIVAKTTGALQMQQMDLAMHSVICSSIACAIGMAKRVYGLVGLYSRYNHYYPADLVESMGFDWEDLKNNRNVYLNRLKNIIDRFNVLSFLAFSYVPVRQYALSHNIYLDDADPRSQITYFQPTGLYKFTDPSELTLDYYEFAVTSRSKVSFERFLDEIDEALLSVENSSTSAIVRGNILRAFPESAFVSQEQVSDDYFIEPKVDRNINWQIQHMRWAPINVESLQIRQYPEDNFLQCVPQIQMQGLSSEAVAQSAAQAINRNYVFLNVEDRKDQTDEFIMESTRLVPWVSCDPTISNGGDSWIVRAYLDHAGTEIPVRVKIFNINRKIDDGTISLGETVVKSSDWFFNTDDSVTDARNLIHTVGVMAPYRIKPRLYATYPNFAQFPGLNYQFSDLNCYTMLHEDQLDSLYTAAMLSVYSGVVDL